MYSIITTLSFRFKSGNIGNPEYDKLFLFCILHIYLYNIITETRTQLTIRIILSTTRFHRFWLFLFQTIYLFVFFFINSSSVYESLWEEDKWG